MLRHGPPRGSIFLHPKPQSYRTGRPFPTLLKGRRKGWSEEVRVLKLPIGDGGHSLQGNRPQVLR